MLSINNSMMGALGNSVMPSVTNCPLPSNSFDIAHLKSNAGWILQRVLSRKSVFQDLGFTAVDVLINSQLYVHVAGYTRLGKPVEGYIRTLPGINNSLKGLSLQAVSGALTVLGVGMEALTVSRDPTLTTAQRLGRTSVALLEVNPIVLGTMVGLHVFLGDKAADNLVNDAFSSKDPVVEGLADMMLDHSILLLGIPVVGERILIDHVVHDALTDIKKMDFHSSMSWFPRPVCAQLK